jgi:hypothetical protein
MNGEWQSSTPDGREVVVRRRGRFWLVRCGRSLARSENLDVALTRAIRADPEVAAQARGIDYPSWIRAAADTIDPLGDR